MEILKGERLSAWSKVLHPPNFSQLSSPTHDVELDKSYNYIAYALFLTNTNRK